MGPGISYPFNVLGKVHVFNSIQFNSIVYLSLMLIYNIHVHTIINIKQYELYQPILYRITRDCRWQISKHYTYIYTYKTNEYYFNEY